MTDIIDKHMPVRKLLAKERKQTLKPWITPVVLAKIDTTNKLYKKIMKKKVSKFDLNLIEYHFTPPHPHKAV